jgi:Flp pilus assembly pilin Flp
MWLCLIPSATQVLKKEEFPHMKFSQFIKNLHREESGQDLLEYALVLAAVLVAVVAGSNNLAGDITNAIIKLNSTITSQIDKVGT